MTQAFQTLWQTARTDWRRLVLWGFAFALSAQVFMMIALMVRFQGLPNYVEVYNWFGNVAWIIQSTPSWGDVAPIVAEEWLIEIGFMNYDYGMGISEWSLNVIPSRVMTLFILGMMVGLCFTLSWSATCSLEERRKVTAATGAGTVLVAMTNATMSWVVCCAAPSWVVGLAMLGLGVNASLAIENLGPLFAGTGFAILTALAIYLAWTKTRALRLAGVPTHA